MVAPRVPALAPRYLQVVPDLGSEAVELATGAVLGGPLLTVRSEPLRSDAPRHVEVCELFLERLRTPGPRVWNVTHPVPPTSTSVPVTVLGLPDGPVSRTVLGAEAGNRWAAVLELPTAGVRIVVGARGVLHGPLLLEVVDDLTPWWEGRAAVDEGLSEVFDGPAGADLVDLPPARGFEAHEAFASLVTGFPVHLGSELVGRTWAAVEERAVRAQMSWSGDDRATAAAAVTSFVHHLRALDDEAVLGPDVRLRAAAVAESARWTAFDSPVPSSPAQLAWRTLREFPSLQADQAWRRAWQQWVNDRRG